MRSKNHCKPHIPHLSPYTPTYQHIPHTRHVIHYDDITWQYDSSIWRLTLQRFEKSSGGRFIYELRLRLGNYSKDRLTLLWYSRTVHGFAVLTRKRSLNPTCETPAFTISVKKFNIAVRAPPKDTISKLNSTLYRLLCIK